MSDHSQHTLVQDQLDVEKIRADFPLLKTKIRDKQLIYFDNGATAQKPEVVLRTIDEYYRTYNANVTAAFIS